MRPPHQSSRVGLVLSLLLERKWCLYLMRSLFPFLSFHSLSLSPLRRGIGPYFMLSKVLSLHILSIHAKWLVNGCCFWRNIPRPSALRATNKFILISPPKFGFRVHSLVLVCTALMPLRWFLSVLSIYILHYLHTVVMSMFCHNLKKKNHITVLNFTEMPSCFFVWALWNTKLYDPVFHLYLEHT